MRRRQRPPSTDGDFRAGDVVKVGSTFWRRSYLDEWQKFGVNEVRSYEDMCRTTIYPPRLMIRDGQVVCLRKHLI